MRLEKYKKQLLCTTPNNKAGRLHLIIYERHVDVSVRKPIYSITQQQHRYF